MKARPKHVAEYILLRGVVGGLNLLPYRVALAGMWCVAGLLHRVFRFRRAEALRRIHEVLGEELSGKEAGRIAWLSWRNLCFNIVDMARSHRFDRTWVEKHVDVREVDVPLEWMRSHEGGLIFSTLHMGNWDLAGIVIRILGMPAFFIARRQRNPLTNEYLNRMRQSHGEEIISSDQSNIIRAVARRLKQGEVLAILPDVRLNAEALKVRYLGKTANLAPGVAAMASLARCPVFPGMMLRRGWDRFEMVRKDTVYPNPEADREQDIRRMMQELMDICTEWVHEYPEQYFWYNRRWVLEPYPSPTS